MLKKTIFIFSLIALSLQVFSQTESFRFAPDLPVNGGKVSITYDASKTNLNGQQNISAVVYQFIDYKWKAADLKLKVENNIWSSDFNIPQDCGFLAFKFVSDSLSDNNKDQGYFIMLRDKDHPGGQAMGSYAGWGLARSPKLGRAIPEYIKFKGITDTASFHWLNQEINFFQQSKSKLAMLYATSLKGYMGNGAAPKLTLAAKYLSRADAPENDLLTARKIYANLLENPKAADSISVVINQRFPGNSLERLKAYRSLGINKNYDSISNASLKFLKDFPEYRTNRDFDAENYLNYGSVYQNLIVLGAFKDKNTPLVEKYADSLSFDILPTVYYKLITIPYKRKDVDYATLYKYSKILNKRFDYFKLNQPSELAYLSPKEFQKKLASIYVQNFSIPHIDLMLSQGDVEQTLPLLEQAQQAYHFRSAELNDLNAKVLRNLNRKPELETVLVQSIYNNQASPEMIAMLKEIYVNKNKSADGFENYVQSLKNKQDQSHDLEKLKAQMINKTMPEWEMKDLFGKRVSSKDLVGKIVVMDFWATWCVPCKASFPGMKMAVEKYKNDPNVVFLFVDTQEKGDEYKGQVNQYIKENNYPFQVLFDNKSSGSKMNSEVFDRISKEFAISGIPQKLIIDKKGQLRFISVGFNGSATGLADEISTLIELTKTASL